MKMGKTNARGVHISAHKATAEEDKEFARATRASPGVTGETVVVSSTLAFAKRPGLNVELSTEVDASRNKRKLPVEVSSADERIGGATPVDINYREC